MGKTESGWDRFSNGLETVLMAVSGGALGLGALLICATTLMRYLLNINFAFMQEFPREINPYTVFLITGVLYKGNKHINVDILDWALAGKGTSTLTILRSISVIVVGCVLFWASLLGLAAYIQTGEVTTEEIEIPIWLLFLSQVIGFAALLLFAVEMLVKEIFKLIRPASSEAKKA